MSDFVSAIIVAAGSSTRMGTADSKQFIPLLGKPAIAYTLSAFESCDLIREIILVCREQDMPRIREIADTIGCQKLTAMVPGGESRQDSVCNGIAAVSPQANYFAIHDGARPLITVEEIAHVTEAALETGAATLGTAVTDTIKVVGGENIIESTPDRAVLRAVQTPQVFEKALYMMALDEADEDECYTDDCALIEHMGGEVTVVEGTRENIKLTTPIDIVLAESILKNRS